MPKEMGVEHYVNTAGMADPIAELMAITQDHGYDDAFVYAPIRQLRRWEISCWHLTAA